MPPPVDFDKMRREQLGPEKYAAAKSREAYFDREKRMYAELDNDALITMTLHTWHNSSCTNFASSAIDYREHRYGGSANVNGWSKYDCVYDAALVYRSLPRILLRLMHTVGGEMGKLAEKLEAGKEVKCPMENCTGYVELP